VNCVVVVVDRSLSLNLSHRSLSLSTFSLISVALSLTQWFRCFSSLTPSLLLTGEDRLVVVVADENAHCTVVVVNSDDQ
jgi:hypothetical protein